MRYIDSAFLIFAKAPIEGFVKTRLIPALGESGATQLYRRLLHHLVYGLVREQLAAIELWCTPDSAHPDFARLQQLSGVSLHKQQSGDLGERMYHAVQESLGRHQHVILLGVDCPALTMSHFAQALSWLHEGTDAVLGPVEDGGYALLGISQAADCLFTGIPWSTDKVTELTRQGLKQMNWKWRELPLMWDLDRPEDLRRLRELRIDL
ncbi:MAG: TIGR04282 family arsenosugar biosynthesis glycosyltransferase [Pseudomonadota bacterium]